MNVLSLFDGMSCGRIALERADIEVDNYYSSEIDKYAIKVANKNYPQDEENRLGDVTEFNEAALPKIDLLIGGSPCQGFSFAGKQLNFEDERSKLFFIYYYMLKKLKPKYFMLENVKMKKEYQDIITEYLGVEPIEINSSLFSAQNRPRLYWTNISFDNPVDKKISFKSVQENVEFLPIRNWMNSYYGDKKRIDQLRTIDADKSFCLTTNRTHNKSYYLNSDRTMCRQLTRREMERLQTVPDGYTDCVSISQAHRMLGNGWTIDVIAHIFKGLKDDY